MNKAVRLAASLAVAALMAGGWAGHAVRGDSPQLIEHRCAGDRSPMPAAPTSRTHGQIEVKAVHHQCEGGPLPTDGSIPGIPPAHPGRAPTLTARHF